MNTPPDLHEIKELVKSTIEQLRFLGKELDAKDNQLINDYHRYDGAKFYINMLADKLDMEDRL